MQGVLRYNVPTFPVADPVFDLTVDMKSGAPWPDVIAADRAALATAQLNLAKAQTAAKGGRIVAPFDAVVSGVFIAALGLRAAFARMID